MKSSRSSSLVGFSSTRSMPTSAARASMAGVGEPVISTQMPTLRVVDSETEVGGTWLDDGLRVALGRDRFHRHSG
jgi:hypothetical protein